MDETAAVQICTGATYPAHLRQVALLRSADNSVEQYPIGFYKFTRNLVPGIVLRRRMQVF